jgi:hypothetical protein
VKLTLISWNIRHLKKQKVEKHEAQIIKDMANGHVIFLYENKMNHIDNADMYDLLASALGSAHGNKKGVEIANMSIGVGTNEFVQVVYTAKRLPGPHSRYDPDQTIEIDVTRNNTLTNALWDAGWERLKASYNRTVVSEIAHQQIGKGVGYRIPAVVDIAVRTPDWTRTTTLTVAAWHAPGPAKATAPALFEVYAKVLDDVHLFVGDFNYNPDSRFSPKTSVGNLHLERMAGSTTLREDGSKTSHTSGPDLVYYNSSLIHDPMKFRIGKTCIGNVEVREDDIALGDRLYKLSDHRPVVVTLKNL